MKNDGAQRLSRLGRQRLEQWRDDMGKTVICAVSGGIDSMCLLHLTAAWGAERGIEVIAAHFHHGLRGETADRDQDFVRTWCAGQGIPFVTKRGDTAQWAASHGLTVEEAGRELRYAFLRETARQKKAGLILTAHHADDNAETMLLNLCRGTGSGGLMGIPPRRGEIARPLIEVTRQEMEAYGEAFGIPHVEDETNASDFAARNLLRHQVIPVLRRINPRAVENMGRTAAIVRQENEAVEAQVTGVLHQVCRDGEAVRLPVAALEQVPEALRQRVFLELWKRMEIGRKDLGSVHLQQLSRMSEGSELHLPHGMIALREEGQIELRPRPRSPGEQPLPETGTLLWGRFEILCRLTEAPPGPDTITLRRDAGPLRVSVCRGTERMELPGSRGGRSVKRLFADRGIPVWQREDLPAVYAGQRIAAVWKVGVDRAFLPRPGEKALQIEITEKGNETWERA